MNKHVWEELEIRRAPDTRWWALAKEIKQGAEARAEKRHFLPEQVYEGQEFSATYIIVPAHWSFG